MTEKSCRPAFSLPFRSLIVVRRVDFFDENLKTFHFPPSASSGFPVVCAMISFTNSLALVGISSGMPTYLRNTVGMECQEKEARIVWYTRGYLPSDFSFTPSVYHFPFRTFRTGIPCAPVDQQTYSRITMCKYIPAPWGLCPRLSLRRGSATSVPRRRDRGTHRRSTGRRASRNGNVGPASCRTGEGSAPDRPL